MRVIAGELRGRRLVAPRGWRVRPTSDRVREAVFSALGEIEGASVLDLYCGTGALSVEALSRGAARATLVDRDTRPALGNIEALGLRDRTSLIKADVPRWLSDSASLSSYDLIFVDAPYRLADRIGPELDSLLPQLLAEGGRVIAEGAAKRPLELPSLERTRERRYGGTHVSFFAVPQGNAMASEGN
jgi:16S rRNA (guanine966-N2)-methyltransferase